MKRLLLLLALFASSVTAFAQRTITGKVVESDSKEAMVSTTVKLLKPDSTLAKGVVTTADGDFKLSAPADGRYILRISSIGYKDIVKNLTVADGKDIALGTLAMKPDAIMLKGAEVTSHVAKVTLKEDTFVYNAAAYRTPEGSVVEELVKRLPGAQVSDDGTIKINGKEVKKILVDGKEFMTGDTKTAMKNLPTSIVEKVKAYDEKSDLARVSGIDDGEEQTVLDFGIKKGMNRGYMSNVDLAYGTDDRYAGRVMGMSFGDRLRVMAFGNANNTNDMGFPGGGGGGRFGGGRQGLTASKMVGLNMNYEIKDKFKLDGSVRWNHSDGDAWSRSSSENFVTTSGSFSNNVNQNFSRSDSWNAQMRLEWMPDTMTNIMFRPSFSYSKSDGTSQSQSGTYNDDPYLYVANPLDEADMQLLAKDALMVNSRRNQSISYSDSKSVNGNLQVNRKLNSSGRNVTLRLNGSYSDGNSESLQMNNVHLYQLRNYLGTGDSTYQTNRYNLTPTKRYSFSAKATYSEPIMKATYLQFSYQFQYNFNKSERSTYDFSTLAERFNTGITPAYRGFASYLGRLATPWEEYLDDSLSRYSEYTNYIHTAELQLRVIRKAYNFNVGVQVIPQQTRFVQDYLAHKTDTTRNIVNFTPTADFRWKISKVSQLRFNYRGSTSQPSMTDLIEVTDNSDPLNISTGNSGLKPSFTNRLFLFYNNYFEKRKASMMVHLDWANTQNSVARKVTYNAETGGRITRPENINGNWNMSGAFMYNTSIDTAGYFYVNTFTRMSYNNNVGFVQLNRNETSVKTTTKDLSLDENLTMGYRNDWLEFELTGGLNYRHSKNELQATANMDTWRFNYGFNTNVQLPWGTTLATDLTMNSRRGYSDASLNTNELIWNAQISHGFLKGKPLTLSLQFYDILHEQSNFSRTLSALERSDVEYNAITSYAMLHVIYRLNIFGNRSAREGMRQGPPDGGPGGPGGPRGGGRRGGGPGFGGPRF